MRNNIREAQLNGFLVSEEIFTQADLDSFIGEAEFGNGRIEILEEDCWVEWSDWPGWQFGFCSAGHDDGARSFMFETPDGERVYATGDIASHNQEVPKGVMLPDERECRGC